jgi:metal-responsive CopG/Arc/MetJ family transcriptional regulator
MEIAMATVNFSVPDEVKAAFDRTFKGQNKSAVIAELMRQAVNEAKLKQRRAEIFRSLTESRSKRPSLSDAELRTIRRSGRP